MASPVPLSNDEVVNHRWEMIPDASGKMHLIDLNQLEVPIEPLFNADSDIILLLFTRLNPTVGQRLFMTEASLRSSNFNPSHPTRVTIHGWLGSQNDDVNIEVTSAYLRHGDYNVSNLLAIKFYK